MTILCDNEQHALTTGSGSQLLNMFDHTQPSTPLPIGPTEIHLWLADYASMSLPLAASTYCDHLSRQEKSHLKTLSIPQIRDRFLASRYLLRTTLSRYRSIDPADWPLAYNRHGKPRIAIPGINLYFNLSHAGKRIALAIGPMPCLGVDLEFTAKKRNVTAIANGFFSVMEQDDLMALDEKQRQQKFYQLWTLKEAFFKARGCGLTRSLADVSFSTVDAKVILHTTIPQYAAPWRFWTVYPEPGYCLSIAASSLDLTSQVPRRFQTLTL